MKTNKLKKCMITNSENSIDTINLSQVISNSNLNNQFWNSLKETINMRRESETIKARIFTAKKILTPIIQELMKDTLQQIETKTLETEVIEGKSRKEIKEKEIQVLYNNLKVGDIWHDQKDMFTDGEEWAMKILREISRDFEQPFDGEKIKMNENGQSNKDIFFNEKLLPKLVTIHQHLGNIIERLNQRCRKKRIVNSDDSLNSLSNKIINIDNYTSTYSRSSIPRKMNEQKINLCTISSFSLINQKVGYPTKKHSSLKQSRIQLTVEHACSVINLENVERGTYSMSRNLLYDVAISYDALFEESKNDNGNKEIVIKCLDDLERVRSYLEAIRDNKECDQPKFCDVESCKNDRCLESEPHLHSNLHNVPMVLKLNKHAEDKECINDLIIGIPTISETSPDVHILLNTKDQHAENKHVTENNNQTTRQRKNPHRVSRIPKLITKKPTDLEKSVKSRSMKITLENKDSSRRKPANLLIFDPDDPCKSIIKMKEQKNEETNDSKSVVSKVRYKLTYKKDLIMFLVICCIGGKYAVWFFILKHLFSDFVRLYIAEIYLFIIYSKFWPSLDEDGKMIANLEPPVAKYKRFWISDRPRFDYYEYLDENMNQLLRSILLREVYAKKMFYRKDLFRRKDKQKYLPRTQTQYFVYFFQCFKENEPTENRQYSSQGRWGQSAMNSTVNPMWTIKRSKYYTVPQNKKKKDEKIVNERTEKTNERIKLKIVNSLANIKESHHEINLQLSEVSLHNAEFRKVGQYETGSDKMCQKNEIKRKVSFREDVDVSEPDVDKEDQDSDLLTKIHDDERQHQSNKVENENMLDDIKEMSIRIPNLLMTESLLKIGRDISRFDSNRAKRTTKKISPKSLTLTESARHVLEKLSKSFAEEQYKSISNDVVTNFYDETDNRIIEIRKSDGDLLHSLKNKNLNSLNPDLFDSVGKISKNKYNIEERRIRSVYDDRGRTVSRFQETNVQADLGVSQYYDHRGKPIQHLYDSSGYEINTIGRDLTSKIFNEEGRLQMNIYSKSGRRIDAVYDSKGRLLGRVSYSQLEPLLRTEQVRVANLDGDSLNKLFESETTVVKLEEKDIKQEDICPKRFFDQEGNPLIGVYDKKGKPLKVTSSGEADELLPFLFDTKGKLQRKRYDSKGKKLKAVFGEDGKAISGMSIAWLNDLLANSKSSIPKIKKKESFFKKISLHKTKKENLRDIDKLYDSKGKIITSVFDSEGKALAVSLSGDAEKILPFLFDKNGKFIRKRYDTSKRKLGYVYGRDGKKIKTISITYLENVAAKLASHENKEEYGERNANKTSSGKESPVSGDKTVETAESDQYLSYFEKVPDHLFDDNGNLLTEIVDNDGKILESSSSGNAWKLLTRLFDEKGNFLEGRFDKQGKKLEAVYNKEGKFLNDILSTAIKIAAEEASKRNECSDYINEFKDSGEKKVLVDQAEGGECEENFKNDENYETKPKSNRSKPQKKQKNVERKRKGSVLKLSKVPTPTSKTPSKNGALELSTFNLSKKEKNEKKQLKPTALITMKQSIIQKFDEPELNAKAGESIDKFYDENGIIITKLYDAEGRILVEDTTGDVEKLAKFLFDKDGFLHGTVYDREGKKITQIFDHKKRSVSRISVQSIISGAKIPNKTNRKDKKLPGRVYDKNGSLVQEIYDKKGHPIIVTRHAKLLDLAPIIFDEKGVRRRIYNKSGYEIGPIYDYKGNLLKHMPYFEKPRLKQDCKEAWIFNKSGRPLRNFYDSDGTLIISLFNDYGQALCSVKKGVDNVDLLSKFFFDKAGNFHQDRFYNYRGQIIKRIYDSDGNIISSIRRTKSRKIAHHKSPERKKEKVSSRSNNENANKVNSEMTKQKGYHGKSEVRPVENIVRLSSHSDTLIHPEAAPLHRSLSTYSLRDYPVKNELGGQSSTSPISSLMNLSVKKFYDENGKLLTGVYNSRARLLGYSASGNARVLAPYLFDSNGDFISGRYNLSRKPLKHVYDFNGKLVDKISKLVLKSVKKIKRQSKKIKKSQIHDENGNIITSIYDHDGKKLLDVTDSWDELENLLDENGKFKRNVFNSRGSILKLNENNKIIRNKSDRKLSLNKKRRDLLEKRYQKEFRLKDRTSALNNFRDKILTVIFDNQNRICEKFSLSTDHKKIHNNKTKNTETKARRKFTKPFLYDNDSNPIKNIYDDRGKKIIKLYNSDGKVIRELYSTSGTLIKNNVLASMFEDNVFRPKVYNSEGNMITAIFANNKKLKKVYDEKGAPAKVESDLVYLVSKQSLPVDEVVPSSKSASKPANYFSEGSAYHFPEGQLQYSKIQNQQLIGQNYETEINVAFNGFSMRRTDNCTCEHCQNKPKNRKSIVGIGGELLDRLSRLTIPLAKFLPRALLRRETRQDSEELEDFDSLETLIDEVAQQSEDVGKKNNEYYGSCSRVSLLESDDTIPISRKLVEKTLRNCVHLNSSTDVVGKVSDMVLHHFANLILQEIEQKFYHKLDVLQCGRSSSVVFERDQEKDICIGTELKFEDSLIGKHFSAQTADPPFMPKKQNYVRSTQNIKLYEYLNNKCGDRAQDSHEVFVCKMASLRAPVMMMSTKTQRSFGEQ